MIGDPIAHSYVTAMHNKEMETLNVHAHYHPFHIKRADLQTAIEGMKAIGVEGFNMTIPHKTTIIPSWMNGSTCKSDWSGEYSCS